VERLAAGAAWHDNNLVFCHEDGRMYSKDALHWRFSKMTRRAGIGHWHAHEGRHPAIRGEANVMDTVFGDDAEHKNSAADMSAAL
jgi:hypothetical protein